MQLLIYKRVRALAEEKGLKVYVFAEDVAASGGYLLAIAGDEIYADASSTVGPIGVVTATFGFNELIDKIGVEARLYRRAQQDDARSLPAGEGGRRRADQGHPARRARGVHRSRQGEARGAHREGGEDLFTGEFWSGRKALELGLIDGLGDLRTKMRELYGDEVRFSLVAAVDELAPPQARRPCA